MLGFIIFGWKTGIKELGATYPTPCPHCNNDSYFELVKSRRWFKLYFIPILPLSRAEYDLVCPICSASIRMETRADIAQVKHLNESATAYLNDELNEDRFVNEIDSFTTDVLEDPGSSKEKMVSPNFEGASTSFLRVITFLFFVYALAVLVLGIVNFNPSYLALSLLGLPYLGLRYRDPASTTIPFSGYLRE